MLSQEEEARKELLAMTPGQLANVPHDTYKWRCCIAGCDRYSSVRDFGIGPVFYWRRKWVSLSESVYYCARHWSLLRDQVRRQNFEGITFKPEDEINVLSQ